MIKKSFYLLILLLVALTYNGLKAQVLNGTVYEIDEQNKKIPLPGVNIWWDGTETGTSTDNYGNFSIARPAKGNPKLIVSYVGYQTDSLGNFPRSIEGGKHLENLTGVRGSYHYRKTIGNTYFKDGNHSNPEHYRR